MTMRYYYAKNEHVVIEVHNGVETEYSWQEVAEMLKIAEYR